MNKLPAVPISGEVVVTAAAEVFGVPPARIRASAYGSEVERRARDACAWVLRLICDEDDKRLGRKLGGKSGEWVKDAAARCEMRRDTSIDFAMQTDALLAGVYAVGRLGLGRAVSGIDAVEEARRMRIDPVRAVKGAPVAVMAAIVEQLADYGDIVELARLWIIARDEVAATGSADAVREERAFGGALREALGLPDERAEEAA